MARMPVPIDVRSQQLPSADGGATYPVGDYPCVAVQSEIRAAGNDAESGLVEYTFEHIAPSPYAGQKFKRIFNVFNKNPDAVRIGTQELASFGACVGVYAIGETDDLLRKPLLVCWRPRRDKPDVNEAKGFKDANGNDPVNAGRGPQPGGQPAAQQAAAPVAQPAGWGAAAPAAQHAAAPVAQPPGWGAAAAPAAQQQQPPAPSPAGWTGGPAAPAAPAVAGAPAWAAGAPAAGGGAPAWAAPR